MAKLKNETIKTDANGHTTTVSKSFALKTKTSEDFFFTFISFMKPMLKIKSMRDVYVLTKLCTIMEFDSSKVFLPAERGKQIRDELGMKPSHFSNSISSLRKLGLLSGGGGVLELNPIFFWKGRTDVRDKLLKEEGLEIKLKFGALESEDDITTLPLPEYNPMYGGSKQFDNEA